MNPNILKVYIITNAEMYALNECGWEYKGTGIAL